MCPGRKAQLKLIFAHMTTLRAQPLFDTALISPTLRCGRMTPFGENWTMWWFREWIDHTNFRSGFLRENNVRVPAEDRLVKTAVQGMRIRVTVNRPNRGTNSN